MRKFHLNKIPSVESAEVEQRLEMSEESAFTNSDEDMSTDDSFEVLDELHTTTEALESLIVSMESSLAEGGLTRQALGFAQMHAKHVVDNVGLELTLPSMEAAGSRVAATESAIDSLKDAAVKAYHAIIEFMKRLYKSIAKKLNQFKDWLLSTATETFEKLAKFTDDKFNVKVSVNVAVFKVNGAYTKKAAEAVRSSLDIFLRLSETTNHENKLYSMFDDVSSGNNNLSTEEQLQNIDAIASQAYAEYDKLLKFDSSTNLTTTLVAGESRVGLKYDNGDPRSFSVFTERTPEEYKLVSLRDLGVDKSMGDKLTLDLDRLLRILKKMQAQSDMKYGNRWDKYKHITREEQHQERVKLCGVLSAIISRCERVQIDALGSVYGGFSVLQKAVRDVEKAEYLGGR